MAAVLFEIESLKLRLQYATGKVLSAHQSITAIKKYEAPDAKC